MTKGLQSILLPALSSLLALAAGCEDSGGLAIAGKTGTLGFGGEVTTAISSDFNARVGGNVLDLDFDADIDDIDYDMGLNFSSFTLLVDWFAFGSPLRLTGGVIFMDHEVDLRARGSAGELEGIGDGTYDWANVGLLSGDIEVDGAFPYIGIGWGNILDKSKTWGFYSDAGIAFTRSPDVSLSATGSPAGLAADLTRESKDIEDELEALEFYPVLSAGFFFRF